MLLSVILLVGAVAGCLGFCAYRSIIIPLREVLAALRRIASGQPHGLLRLHDSRFFSCFADPLETIAANHVSLTQQIHERQFDQEAILSSMNEGVAAVDGSRTVRLVNQSFLKLFNLQTPPLGQTLLSALRNSELEILVRDALSDGAPQSREILTNRNVAATHLAVSVMPLETRGSKANGAVIVFHDISRLRQLEEVRKEFVANVSHELRTPLSILSGYLENLVDRPTMSRKEQAAIFSTMERHTVRLKTLLDDLLTLARLESRGDSLDFENVELISFLQQLATDWRNRFADKHLNFALNIAPDLPGIVADEFRLQQVLDNLFDNAVKYTPEQGTIILSARAEADHVEIKIRDNGIGIPPSDLPHIFERFYRVDKARSREKGGTGLGLSIVKHIVTAHGGRVTAGSVYGKETTVTVCLPLLPPSLAQQQQQDRPAAALLPESQPRLGLALAANEAS